MSLMVLGIAYVIVLLAGLLLISELRTCYGQRRLRERSGEFFSESGDVYNAGFMGLPVDTGHGYGGSCGGIGGYGHSGGCDGGGHGA
jgi:hypothetical protein